LNLAIGAAPIGFSEQPESTDRENPTETATRPKKQLARPGEFAPGGFA
jgi:hypothetical protein